MCAPAVTARRGAHAPARTPYRPLPPAPERSRWSDLVTMAVRTVIVIRSPARGALLPDEAQPLSSGPRPGDPEAATQGQQAQGAAAPSGAPGPEGPKPDPAATAEPAPAAAPAAPDRKSVV